MLPESASTVETIKDVLVLCHATCTQPSKKFQKRDFKQSKMQEMMTTCSTIMLHELKHKHPYTSNLRIGVQDIKSQQAS